MAFLFFLCLGGPSGLSSESSLLSVSSFVSSRLSRLEESEDESSAFLRLRFYVLKKGDKHIVATTYIKGGAREEPLKSASNWDFFGLFAS